MSKGNHGRSSTSRNSSKTNNSSKSIVRMTKERARAIQSHADKNNVNQDFKSRAMRAADKNEEQNEK